MFQPHTDDPAAPQPPERVMRISPMDMRQQRFKAAFRGYDRTDVVAFLTEAADDYEHAMREIDRLRSDLMRMEALLGEHRQREANLRDTLLTAQRLSDEVKDQAQNEAKLIIREAQGRADLLLQKLGIARNRIADIQRVPWEQLLQAQVEVQGTFTPVMDGRYVFKMATTLMTEVTHEILNRNGLELSDLKLVLMHQANLRINGYVQKALGLPDEKVYNNIQKYGNTTAATIPLLWDECAREGRIQPGDLVLMVAIGGGVHWGATLLRA